ncbi:MAG: glycoside hydrolase family 3 C-terminal domain-containing protein [Clostridia bacterium]|nr:glycoside hydrolase family 3 C-terminal domain-containing protein [Clostridia bacterium]
MDIKQLVSQMTLEEKCSLLSGADFWRTRPVERLGIPAFMVSDGPHGLRKQAEGGDHLGINDSIKAVCLPTASAAAASFDRDLCRQIGEAVGDACQHEKLAVNLGPAINIKRSPLCGRNFEYYSEDPYLAGELATAHTKGLQSRNVGVSVKHFAANSQENRRMSTSAEVDERTLREIYFPAFEKVVRDGKAWTVMCSYNRINGVYSSENPWLLKTVLRDEWGFDGYVVSDWGAVNDRVKGVSAGLDLEMPSSGGSNDRRVMEAVKAGTLDEKDVDACVENILRIHTRYLENAKPETVWDLDAQHELAGKLAAECMVLLKNEDRVLPLKETEKVAVIGKFAAVPRFQGGGSSHINCFRITSLMDELKDCSGVTYAQGYDTADEQPDETLIAEALRVAAEADKAVIVAGLPDSFESEGYDRTHLRMPLCQTELIRRVAEVNPNTIVVLYNGSPVEMPWLPLVKAVVEGYLGGQAVGTATANILYGKVNPCGRLPETLPVKLEDTPCFLSYEGEGDTGVYNEGIFVGYRYYDKKKTDVLFPFGYGLSYTKFEYSNLRLSSKEIRDTDILTVSVDVTNAGSVKGKEVVQLYVGDIESSVFRPVRELKEFGKIELEPGETKTVTFEIGKRAFAYWNTRLHDWHVETGDFRIEICSDSRTVLLSETVRVESTVQVPAHYTVNSIMADLIANPKAMEILRPIMQGGLFGSGENSGDSDAAGEAISDEMAKAMMMNMPLRSIASFSGGALTYDMIQKMVDQINNG